MSFEARARRTTALVPVFGSLNLAEACIAALVRTVPAELRILVVDDHGQPRVDQQRIAEIVGAGRDLEVVLNDRNLGFVGTVNKAIEMRPDDDIVLVNSDVTVLPGWYGPLRDAAYATSRTASATALADRGGVVSVVEIAEVADLDDAALEVLRDRVRVTLGRAWVAIPVAVGHLCYLRRDALDAIGGLDEAFSPGYGEEVDWSHRASRSGWTHAVSLTSWSLHSDGGSFGTQRSVLRRQHEWLLLRRYPFRTIRLRAQVRGSKNDLNAGRALVSAILQGTL